MPTSSLAERRAPKDALANLEKVVILGDLAVLTSAERIGYYARVCESLGLNPLTRPFEYISLNGKLTLYARRDATDQLRKVNGISVTAIRRDRDDDLALQIVTVEGQDREGRTDSAIGAVSIKGLAGELLANALMKAETKAKRRMTLSLAGLGWLDETEISDTPPVERKSLLEAIEERTEQLSQPVDADVLIPDELVFDAPQTTNEPAMTMGPDEGSGSSSSEVAYNDGLPPMEDLP
jgi:hypothetical protein